MKKTISSLLGILIGIINVLLGACGGIIAVESLKYNGTNQTKSHATAIAIILPLTIISVVIYILNANVKISDSYVYLIPTVIGSLIGGYLLPKIPKKSLTKAFSAFIIYAGVRMLIK